VNQSGQPFHHGLFVTDVSFSASHRYDLFALNNSPYLRHIFPHLFNRAAYRYQQLIYDYNI